MLVLTAILFQGGTLTIGWFMLLICITFFIASAGASSAYLTVSEIFPMETRALSIAFFFAVGTGIGGIVGPVLFGHLINSGSVDQMAFGLYLGAFVMAIGGVAEIVYGVKAEQKPLEQIARPLTATDAPAGDTGGRRRRGAAARERLRPGPGEGSIASVPMWPMGTTPPQAPLTREVDAIVHALEQNGPTQRAALAGLVGARYWGPGHFRRALLSALAERRIRRVGRGRFDAMAH